MRSIIAVIAALFLTTTSRAQTFTLKSNDLGGQFTNEFTLNGFGCTGTNKSPQLSWTNIPTSAKSFAITMYDGGPCPPAGDAPHPYIITIYALKTAKQGLDKNASPAMVGFMINQQVIEKASLIAYYKR